MLCWNVLQRMVESVEQGTHLSLHETLNILNMEIYILLD